MTLAAGAALNVAKTPSISNREWKPEDWQSVSRWHKR
jgi:hypothetical protein